MSGGDTRPSPAELENLIVRFQDLDARKPGFRPRDILLPRFERDRVSRPGSRERFRRSAPLATRP